MVCTRYLTPNIMFVLQKLSSIYPTLGYKKKCCFHNNLKKKNCVVSFFYSFEFNGKNKIMEKINKEIKINK